MPLQGGMFLIAENHAYEGSTECVVGDLFAVAKPTKVLNLDAIREIVQAVEFYPKPIQKLKLLAEAYALAILMFVKVHAPYEHAVSASGDLVGAK